MEFKINKFLTLKLNGKKTTIYILDKEFLICKFAIFNIPNNDLSFYEELDSMDEFIFKATGQYDKPDIKITPEEEFWIHCSSLQAWTENHYDTHMLDSRLSFPILKRLADVGDIQAEKIFKKELVKRIKDGTWQTVQYLISEGFISMLNQEELLTLLYIEESIVIKDIIDNSPIQKYNLAFDFDELREKFANINRNFYELYNPPYYFSLNGNKKVAQIEILIDKDFPSVTNNLNKLADLQTIYLYCNNTTLQIDAKLSSISHINVYCFGNVKIPNLFRNFPNIETLNIFPDSYKKIFPELDADIFPFLNGINHNLLLGERKKLNL